MVNYACAFRQSELGKYFESIIKENNIPAVQKKTSDVFLCISLEWLNNAPCDKEIDVGLGFGLFRDVLS